MFHTGTNEGQQTDLSSGTPLVMALYSSAWVQRCLLGGAERPANTIIIPHSVQRHSIIF